MELCLWLCHYWQSEDPTHCLLAQMFEMHPCLQSLPVFWPLSVEPVATSPEEHWIIESYLGDLLLRGSNLNWLQREPQMESYPASLLMKEIWFEVWYSFPRFQLTNILKRSLIAYVARKYKMNLRSCWCQEHKVYIFINSVSPIQESVLEDICIYMYRNMFVVTLFVLARNLKTAWIFISTLQLPQI